MLHQLSVQSIIAVSGWQSFREWLLAVGTVLLGVFTFLLWLSTHRMADRTSDAAAQAGAAAEAARESTDVARRAFELESERWKVELDDRQRVHARLVELHLGYDVGSGNVQLECTNRGQQTISKVVFHVKVGHLDWRHLESHDRVGPGVMFLSDRVPVDRDGYATLSDVEATVLGAVTFTDIDGRRWLRWAVDDWLEPYEGNVVQITGRWQGNARPRPPD